MNSKLGHIYLYVSNLENSFKFYKDFLEFLEYKLEHKAAWGFAFSKDGTSIWFEQTPEKYQKDGYHRKRTGLNHLAFKLDSKEDVDKFYIEFLQERNIKTLYKSPKTYPEYSEKYYAVFFEDPDRIKLEVAYHK